jgi:Fur family zinc uptake transcriptional regulator
VHRLESLNAYVGCPQPERSHRGRFLICDACGHVAEFDSAALRTAIADQADHLGFAVRDETVEVRGTCQRCQAASPAAS